MPQLLRYPWRAQPGILALAGHGMPALFLRFAWYRFTTSNELRIKGTVMATNAPNFRHLARQSLARAKTELATNDAQRLRYAALELREAMEALTYDRAL